MNISSRKRESNIPIYHVGELSKHVQSTIKKAFEYVRVKGELGQISRPRSGHLYFELKDADAVLKAVIWKYQLSSITQEFLEIGVEVICTGSLTTYPRQSCYQLTVENIQPAGQGALMALLEKRKKDLEKRGFFKAERKKTIPTFPSCVGVITSLSGSVIKDILHRLEERFPCPVLVIDVPVQGEECPSKIITALDMLEKYNRYFSLKIDVVMIARGGGSFEDLWPFNDAHLIERVACFPIPLISSVGHETDLSLLDLVADVRSPTPTAGSEMITKQTREQGLNEVTSYQKHFYQKMHSSYKNVFQKYHAYQMLLLHQRGFVKRWHDRIESLIKMNILAIQNHFQVLDRKNRQNIKTLKQSQIVLANIEHSHHRASHCLLQIRKMIVRKMQQYQRIMENHQQILVSLDPEHLLKKGYINAFNMKGKLIIKAKQTYHKMPLNLHFQDGQRRAYIVLSHD